MTVSAATRQPLALPAELVPVFCYESRKYAAASYASPADIARAGEVLVGLLRRGITGLPYGVVLDWMLLVEREWDFPSRTLEHAMQDTQQIPRHQQLHGLPSEYENDCLNPWLLSPWMRRARDAMVLRGRTVERIVHLLEQIADGLDSHLHFRIGHYEPDPARLPDAFEALARQEAGIDDDSRPVAVVPGPEALEAKFPGVLPVLHQEVADFLRARLSAEPRPTGDNAGAGTVLPWRPNDVDIYELEHVEIFTSRVARLRCRRFGEIAQRLGPPETRGLQRRVDVPEIVVNRDDETRYPAGGVAELTTSGAFENLLPSELMFMGEGAGGIDLFSLKYVENELLYFVRDAGLLVRRRRRINLVLWDVPGFRIKYPGQPHPLDVWVDGMLMQLIRDLFSFFDGEGVVITAHWVFPDGREVHRTPAASRAASPGGRAPVNAGDDDPGGPRGLFDLLFRTEVAKRLASFHSHASVDSMAAFLRDNHHPFNQWAVLMPPQSSLDDTPASDALRSLLPVWTDMTNRGARPATAVTWHTEPVRPVDGDADQSVGHVALPDRMVCRNADDPGALRDMCFAWPPDVADPTDALRELRQFLLAILISFL